MTFPVYPHKRSNSSVHEKKPCVTCCRLEVRGPDVVGGQATQCAGTRLPTALEQCGGGALYNTVLECVCGDY